MKLSEVFCFDCIIPNLAAKTRDDAIAELVNTLSKAGRLGKNKADDVSKAIIKRENDASTGIGKGVAVPHVKYSGVNSAVAAIGVSGGGIDFSSLDKQPVYVVIVLISPVDNPDNHLQAMEKIFKLLQSDKCRRFLRQSQTVEQIKEVVIDYEEGKI